MDIPRVSLPGTFRHPELILFGMLSIAGLSFGFFVGFPFGNHNESYRWIAQFNHVDFYDCITAHQGLAPNSRPLAMATAWLGYRLFGNSIYPQQLFNYGVAAAAWLLLWSSIQERRLFGWVSFLVGGIFFTSYIILFHLHGVAYSPLLLFLAFLLANAGSPTALRTPRLVSLLCTAVLATLYHPYAIVLCGAYLMGSLAENARLTIRIRLALAVLILAVGFGVVKVVVLDWGYHLPEKALHGALTSYALVEFHPAFSIVSWLLSILTVLTLNASRPTRAALGGCVTVLSLAFVRLSLPVVMVWIGTSLLKSIVLRRWILALLILATAVLPAVTATGSPTYCIFVLMAGCCVLPLGCSLLERGPLLQDALALIVIAIVISTTALLRTGTHLPGISRAVNPILMEREKTFQMEDIIRWLVSSHDLRGCRLVLNSRADRPAESTNNVNRTHRPPTYQVYLDEYVESLELHPRNETADQLLVSFGGEEIGSMEPVFTVAGRYNGVATVWRREN